jgi:predicted nuclease with RNAse H fold
VGSCKYPFQLFERFHSTVKEVAESHPSASKIVRRAKQHVDRSEAIETSDNPVDLIVLDLVDGDVEEKSDLVPVI